MKAIIQVNQDLDWSNVSVPLNLNTLPEGKGCWTVMVNVDLPTDDNGITTGDIQFLVDGPHVDELLQMEFPLYSGHHPILMCEVLDGG